MSSRAQHDPLKGVEIPGRDALKSMSVGGLTDLAASIRRIIAAAVEANGGHLASNMGVVELTVALHRVFDFPPDRLLFDVGHQCYAHKILTGRRDGFRFLRSPGGVGGFPDPAESPADTFVVGHAGTALSTAAGLAEAARLKGEKAHVVVLVGDAAVQNGMSLEALNHLGETGLDVLIVLNDNEMSISATVGAISRSISRLRTDPRYSRLKSEIARLVEMVPVFGKSVEHIGGALKDAVKRAVSPGAVFEILGIDYLGPVDGHDVAALLRRIEAVRDLPGPRLLHVVTKKGFGHQPAQDDPTGFHSAPAVREAAPPAPSLPDLPRPKADSVTVPKVAPEHLRAVGSYSEAFGRVVTQFMREDERVVALTAAMLHGTKLDLPMEEFPDRVHDVGIAESHAVGFCAGLAGGGMKPICAVYSTFLQRGLDQVFQEVCLQPGLGVTFALDRAGVVGGDGSTHQGLYDVACLRALPGMVLAAPRDALMLEAMLRQGLSFDGPYTVRFPKDKPPEPLGAKSTLELGRGEVLRKGGDVALVGYGAAVEWCVRAAEILTSKGIEPTVIDLRFASPLDEDLLRKVAGKVGLLVTVEDGVLSGGVGEAVCSFLARSGLAGPLKVVTLGVPEGRLPHASRQALLKTLGLTADGVAEVVEKEIPK